MKRNTDGFRALRLSKIEDGKVKYLTNLEMERFGYSVEQYEKMAEIKQKKETEGLEINGKKVKTFDQFVRARLQHGKEAPLAFLELNAQELIAMYYERELFVQQGWNDVLNNGAITFPNDSSYENI